MKQTKQIFALIVWLAFLSTTTTKAGGTYYMTVGQTKTLSFSTSRVIKSASWYSASWDIVEVTSYGGTYAQIKAVKSFSSYVIVRCDYYYWITSGTYRYLAAGFEDFNIYVNPINPTNINIQSSLTMDIGDYTTITPTLTPSNAETTLTWSSDNTSVATVSSDGEIHAMYPGTANITVRTSNGLFSTCKVTVPQPSFILREAIPTNNAQNIFTNTAISTEFSLYIFQGPKYTEISLMNLNTGIQTSGTSSISGNKLLFTPTKVLEMNTNYKFTIPIGAIQNLWGTAYSSIVEVNFKTKSDEVSATNEVQINPLFTNINNGILHVSGLTIGEVLRVYCATGNAIYYGIVKNEEIDIPLRTQGVFIVKAGNKMVKVVCGN